MNPFRYRFRDPEPDAATVLDDLHRSGQLILEEADQLRGRAEVAERELAEALRQNKILRGTGVMRQRIIDNLLADRDAHQPFALPQLVPGADPAPTREQDPGCYCCLVESLGIDPAPTGPHVLLTGSADEYEEDRP